MEVIQMKDETRNLIYELTLDSMQGVGIPKEVVGVIRKYLERYPDFKAEYVDVNWKIFCDLVKK